MLKKHILYFFAFESTTKTPNLTYVNQYDKITPRAKALFGKTNIKKEGLEMLQLPKRAGIIYPILQKEISQMDFSKRGEERATEFLRATEFENASEILKNSLVVIEEQKIRCIKTNDIFHALEDRGIKCNWQEYYLQLQSDFRRWCHCEEIRKVAGKPTGANDLFRLYTIISGRM